VLTEVENWMGRGSSLHHIGEQKTCPEGMRIKKDEPAAGSGESRVSCR